MIEARNGESAIELLNDEPIDLLITDMVMPKVDGPAVIAHARHKMPQLPVTTVVTPWEILQAMPGSESTTRSSWISRQRSWIG